MPGAASAAQQHQLTGSMQHLEQLDGAEVREPDNDMLEISKDAVSVREQATSVLLMVAERQKIRLLPLPYRSWCILCVIGRGS